MTPIPPPPCPTKDCNVSPKQQYLSLILAERIIEVFEESGASEPEKYAALDVARALVPVLPNASCSVENNEALTSLLRSSDDAL